MRIEIIEIPARFRTQSLPVTIANPMLADPVDQKILRDLENIDVRCRTVPPPQHPNENLLYQILGFARIAYPAQEEGHKRRSPASIEFLRLKSIRRSHKMPYLVR